MPIIDRSSKINLKDRAKQLQEQRATAAAAEKGLIEIAAGTARVPAGVGTIGVIKKIDRPFASAAEQKVARAFSGSSVGVRNVAIPMRNVDFGLREDARWWSGDTAVDKSDSYEFRAELRDLDGGKLVVSRVWSESQQRKIFYGELPDGSVRNMDHLDGSRLVPYFLDDAIKMPVREPIIICEGYRAAKALRDHGFQAVGAVDGSTMPHPDIFAMLKGRSVILWPDNDDVGVALMANYRMGLLRAGANEVKLLRWLDGPLHGDAANVPGGKAAISKLLETASDWPAPLLEDVARPARVQRLGRDMRLRAVSVIAQGGRG